MKELLSPNQVAKAIGVSESSLKRWADQGKINSVRTAGGHRRLPVASVLEFVRNQGLELADASILGLPPTTGTGARTLDRGRDHLIEAIRRGSLDVAIQVVIDLYLVPYRLSDIFDDVMRPALETVGHHQAVGEMEIYEERRSIDLSARILHELSRIIPAPETTSPLAIGGTLDGDPYTTATKMAELVLRSAGYRAVTLGNELPFATIEKAIDAESPGLVWLSVSAIRDRDEFISREIALYEHCVQAGTLLVLGGVALDETIRSQIRFHGYCRSMGELEQFGTSYVQMLRARMGDAKLEDG